MKSLHERKIKEGARPYLSEGEEVAAAFVARPRGWTQAAAGSLQLGAAQQGRAYAAGEAAGFQPASPMALAVTDRRLLSLRIGSPIGLGVGGAVKELVSAAPLAAVDEIQIRKLGLGKVVTVTVAGQAIALEANVLANAEGVVAAFERAKAAVPA